MLRERESVLSVATTAKEEIRVYHVLVFAVVVIDVAVVAFVACSGGGGDGAGNQTSSINVITRKLQSASCLFQLTIVHCCARNVCILNDKSRYT